jgi:hypothetical protein
MFANGPLVTHPPPEPFGIVTFVGASVIVSLRFATGSPFPEKDVSLPSKSGLADKLLADSAQFQYLCDNMLDTLFFLKREVLHLRLIALVTAFLTQRFLPQPDEAPMPTKEDTAYMDMQCIVDVSSGHRKPFPPGD